jgi:hypothetical protein
MDSPDSPVIAGLDPAIQSFVDARIKSGHDHGESSVRAGPLGARLAAWTLLGLLLAGSALADDQVSAPALAVDPAEPGPDLPPVGRSLFDFLTMQEEGGRTVQVVPFPFTALLAQIEAEIGGPEPSLRNVLIPLGRSLQRNAANPAFFAFPRAVVAVDQGPALRPDEAGMLLADRLYLGYQEKAATIEVISYNEAAGRFEYQVVRDYREGGPAEVHYADRPTCIACHRNHAPIFSKPLWDETNANAAVAATLEALQDEFYGIPVARGVDIPNALDAATDRANSFAALQRVWQEGCEMPQPGEGVACRADALLAVLQYRLAGNRHLAADRDGPGKTFAAALSRQWDVLWPDGLAIPEADVPNRIPLAAPLNPDVLLSEADAIRLTTIERALEPFEPRPPREVWHAPDSLEQGRRLVDGLAGFIAGADIRRLDDFLWQQDAPSRTIEGACEIATVDLADERREIRIGCPPSEGGLALQGYVQLHGDAVSGGAISHLQIDGQVLTNLKIAGGTHVDTRDGQGRLVVQLEERAAGLHARLPDGDAIRALEIAWSPGGDPAPGVAVAIVADDFSMVRDAVAAMRDRTQSGASDALSPAPMRRAALMPALFAALGAEPIDWCCVDDATMPAATLEP